jgi:arylsulfatase A-like enzyme
VDFQRAYTSYAVCCPSRAAMLTGKFPHAAGVPRNHMQLPLAERTMSAELKRAGYRTGYIGKWHLDGRENPGFVPPERRRGFDYWAAYNVAHQHFDTPYFRNSPEPVRPRGFEPDYQTDLAIDFIKQKKEQPFFLYLSWVAPHSPLTPPARHAKYDPAKLRLRPNVPQRLEAQTRSDIAGYYGLCSAVDENLGRLLAELDRTGSAADTIVVFTSDHGFMIGSHGVDGIDEPFEESARIPLLIRYSRFIKPRVETNALVSNVDFAPTLLALCGVDAPPGMHGTDLSRQLTGAGGNWPQSIYAQGKLGQPEEWRMVVQGQRKLVIDRDRKVSHLYDLQSDPYEMSNLADEARTHRQRDELFASLQQWMRRTSDRVPFGD